MELVPQQVYFGLWLRCDVTIRVMVETIYHPALI